MSHASEHPATPGESLGGGPSASKYAWLLDALHRQHNLAVSRPIPRLTAVSTEEFLDRHYAADWPALIAGAAAEWPALHRWSPAHLKAAVGPAMVEVQAPGAVQAGGLGGPLEPQRRMSFGAFLDQALRPEGGHSCLRAAPGTPNGQALRPLLADLRTIAFCQPPEASPGALWIAPADAFTPLHQAVRNTLLVQLSGKTQLLLVAPEATPRLYNDEGVYSRVLDIAEPHVVDWFPRLEGLRVHRVTLSAGDALFIPLGWWRQGKALEFAICATSDRFRWPNDFDRDHPELSR